MHGVNHYQGEGSHLILLAFCGGIMPLLPLHYVKAAFIG